MFNGDNSEKENIEKNLTSEIEQYTKESSSCDIKSNILEFNPNDDVIDLERFYEEKQSKIEEILNQKNQMELKSFSNKNPLRISKNTNTITTSSFQNKKPSRLKNLTSNKLESRKITKEENLSKSESKDKKPSLKMSIQRDNKVVFHKNIKKKEKSISEFIQGKRNNDKSIIMKRSASLTHTNNYFKSSQKKSLVVKINEMTKNDPKSPINKINYLSNINISKLSTAENQCNKEKILTNNKSNFFRKNNNIKDKAEVMKKKPIDTTGLKLFTPRSIYETPLDKDRLPTVLNNDLESLQKMNAMIDIRLNTELSLLKEKLKTVNLDSFSTKAANVKNNYSSLMLNTNETDKISTRLNSQNHSDLKQSELNTKGRINSFRTEIGILDSGIFKDNNDPSEICNLSRLSNKSNVNHSKIYEKNENNDKSIKRLSNSNSVIRTISNSCSPSKIKGIIEKRKELLLINKIEKKEDLYSKNSKWKEEMYIKTLFSKTRNLEAKVEKEKKELNSFSFSPMICKVSKKLCESNDMFKQGNNIYERNMKWKENSYRTLQKQNIKYEKIMYDECFFKPKTNVSLTNSDIKKDKTYVYNKNLVWLNKVNQKIRTAEMENEEKVKAGLFRPDHNNKFYKKVKSTNRSLDQKNSVLIENSSKDYKIVSSSSNLNETHTNYKIKNLSRLNTIVTSIKEFQVENTNYSLRFVDREYDEIGQLITSLKDILDENKEFVKKFDEEFIDLNKDISNISKQKFNLQLKNDEDKKMKRNQSEKIIRKSEKSMKFECKEQQINDGLLDKSK